MKINFGEFLTKGYWKNFFTLEFWFTVDKFRIHGIDYAILVLGSVLFLSGLGMKLFAKKQDNPLGKELYKKFGSVVLYTGVSLDFWFLLRYQNIQYLATHFVAGLIVLAGLTWAFFLFRKIGRTYKTRLSDWQKEQVRLKYLYMK